MNKYFPATAANPTNLVYKLSTPAWDGAPAIAAATTQLQADKVFTAVTGPLNPIGGTGFTAAEYTQLHALLGSGKLPSTAPPAPAAAVKAGNHRHAVGAGVPAVPGDPAVRVRGRQDNPVRDVTGGGRPVHHGGAQRGSRCPYGGAGGGAHAARDRLRRHRRGPRPVRHQLDLQQRPGARHPDRHHRDRGAARTGLRSLVAPLYLIASVAISYFAALGFAVLIFIELGGAGGITFILPFLLFIFLLALGEDYNILVMTRIREEAHRMPLREAVSAGPSASPAPR